MKKIILSFYVILGITVAICTLMIKPLLTNAQLVYTKLWLTSMCSPNPSAYRVWRVRNTNNFPLVAKWDLYGTSFSWTITALASGDTFFQTPTQPGANTTRIRTNNELNNTKASNPAACPPTLNDLIITGSSNKTWAIPWDLITTVFSYTNSGTNTLTGIILKITLSNKLYLFDSSLTGATVSGNIFTFFLDTLTANQSWKITIYSYGDQRITTWNHNIQASITSSTSEQTLTNNNSTLIFPIIQGNQCINQNINTTLLINTNYISPTDDINIQSLSFNGNIFPGLILADAFQQLSPLPNANEISTDRGDKATSLFLPQENPSYSGLLDYIGNNNLNNIIDFEGIKTAILDLRFSQTLVDNTWGVDGYPEIIIFERGVNSDLMIQAVDNLGGTGLGKTLLLKRNQQTTLSGILMDTTEIGAPQKVGYWKVDLSELGVPSVKYLRVIATNAYNGPDIKIMGINTLACSQKSSNLEIKGLTNIISTLPGDSFTYTLTIKNLGIDTNYDIIASTTLSSGITLLTGSVPFVMSGNTFQLSVPKLAVGSSVVYIFTGMLSSDLKVWTTVKINTTLSWLLEDQELINNTDTSAISITTPVKLKLTAVCSTEPVQQRTRRISNTNPMPVPYTWTQGNIQGTGLASLGDSFISTPGGTGNISIQLFAFDNQLQSTKSSNPISCPLPVADMGLSINTQNTSIKAWEIFGAIVHITQQWPNTANSAVLTLTLPNWLENISLSVPYTLSWNTMSITLWDYQIWSGDIILSGTVITWRSVWSSMMISWNIQGAFLDPISTNNTSILLVSQPDILPISWQQQLIDQLLQKDQLIEVDENNEAKLHNAAPVEIELNNPKSLIVSKNQELVWGGCWYDDEDYLNISFKDITKTPAKNAIEFLRLNCIVKGRQINTFKPTENVTKAEAIKIFIKLWGIKNQLKVQGEQFIYLGETPFADVSNIHWAAQYMDIAHQLGLLENIAIQKEGETFINPDEPLTKSQGIELMIKTKLLLHDDMLIKQNQNKPISNLYVSQAISKGFIKEKDPVLSNLDKPISREQLSSLIATPFQNLLKVYKIARN